MRFSPSTVLSRIIESTLALLGVLLVVVGIQLLSLGLLSELITSHHEERVGKRGARDLHVDEILR